MSFNKHLPERLDEDLPRLSPANRAVLLRMATWASLAMLVAGYVLLWFYW